MKQDRNVIRERMNEIKSNFVKTSYVTEWIWKGFLEVRTKKGIEGINGELMKISMKYHKCVILQSRDGINGYPVSKEVARKIISLQSSEKRNEANWWSIDQDVIRTNQTLRYKT